MGIWSWGYNLQPLEGSHNAANWGTDHTPPLWSTEICKSHVHWNLNQINNKEFLIDSLKQGFLGDICLFLSDWVKNIKAISYFYIYHFEISSNYMLKKWEKLITMIVLHIHKEHQRQVEQPS